MKRISAIAAAALLLASGSDALAQSRDFGARRILFDDGSGSGFRTTVEPFAPMTQSGTFTLPNPATTSGTFIMSNSTLGQTITGGMTNNTFFNSYGATTIGNGAGSLTLNLTGAANALLTESSWNTNDGGTTILSFDNTGAGRMDVGIGTATPAGQLANNSSNTLLVGGSTGMAANGFNWEATSGGFAAQIRNSSNAGNANGLGIQMVNAGGLGLFVETNGIGTVFVAEADGDGYFMNNLNLGAGGYMTAGVMRIANNGNATLQATTTTSLSATGAVVLGDGNDNVDLNPGTGAFTLNSPNIDIIGGAITGATGVTSATGNITATAGNINATAGALQTAGVTRIANNGNATLQATTTTTLTASGLVTASNGANVANGLTVGGGSTLNGGATVSGLFTANNDANITGNLTVSGTSNLSGSSVLGDGGDSITINATAQPNALFWEAGLRTNDAGNTSFSFENVGGGLMNVSLTGQLISTIPTGTAPFSIASTTVVPNLNADMVDGVHGTDLVTLSGNQTITGTKTFAVNAAQADAIINSINAGTAFIDWARIGTAGGELGTYDVASGTTIPQALVEANRVIVVSNSTGGGVTFTMPNITKNGHTVAIMRANSGNAITIQDIGNQVLSGNFNNMTPFDVITMLWDGTNWVEMSRSAN